MIRPLENQERFNSSEYASRIRQTDASHSSNSRDFSYEIHEVDKNPGKRREPEQEFGEDTYEATEEESQPSGTKEREQKKSPAEPSTDDTNLDIIV